MLFSGSRRRIPPIKASLIVVPAAKLFSGSSTKTPSSVSVLSTNVANNVKSETVGSDGAGGVPE